MEWDVRLHPVFAEAFEGLDAAVQDELLALAGAL